MSKVRYCFDIETNGLMPDVDTIWCLVIVNIDTNEVHSFSDYDSNLPSLKEGLDKLLEADILTGHNIIGYDLTVLKHLVGWEPAKKTKVIDTWLLSLMNRYKREHKHGLGGWGQQLGFSKIEFNDFSAYTQEMLTYCIRDVELNVKVYHKLIEEAKRIINKFPLYSKGIDVEMRFAMIESEIQRKGWVFNMPAALDLQVLLETRLAIIELTLEPKIGMRCIAIDGKDTHKTPAWRKDGCYTVNTVKHFGYSQESGRRARPIEGPYARVEFVQGKLGTDEVVKDYLFSLGWVPDEYNVKRIGGRFVSTSPKITESSLSILGQDALDILEYNMIVSRLGILRGWIREAEPDTRLHGRIWTIGTPSFRCRHEVVANLPGIQHDEDDKVLHGDAGGYSYEMRSLLMSEEGCSIIGADSAGNQMRGLCHDIGNDEFTDTVINGDVHQRNADVLGVTRKGAKPFLYAFLFGGGDGKLGLILTGKRDNKVGKLAKDKFKDSIPGFKDLIGSLESQYAESSALWGSEMGFIRGLDGRLVFVDSNHKILNYRLQCTEAITCKAAAVYMKDKLLERNIPHYFVLHYHDEFAVVTKDEYAEEVRDLSVEAFTEAPKWFGIQCMNGAAHIGRTYAEVH